MAEVKDGAAWWKNLLGIEPPVTDGERKIMAGNENDWRASQEHQDAMRLIETGRRTGDTETLKIGQARMRFLLGRATSEDLKLFEK